MRMITITASAIIPASSDKIYQVIADYQVGHQAILPKPAFQEMQVLDGGYGAGTRIKVHVRIWGQSYYFDQIVEEPEVGRVIIEREINTGQYTTFTLHPLSDHQTEVTITSCIPQSKGIKGFLERATQPAIIGNMFKIELANLADYVSQKHSVAHNPST